MDICFASHNEHKVKEINSIVPAVIRVVGLKEIGITEEIAETGTTLEENSRIKASYVFELKRMPVFADDSGLLVDSLDGAPGVYSARYAGPEKSDERNMNLLLENLKGQRNRKASFQTVITYIDQQGNESQFKGEVKGEIIAEKRGTNGFGYDPIFQPDGYSETFAELDQQVKNNISHRAKAVQQFVSFLQQING